MKSKKLPKGVPKCDHWVQYKAGPIEINIECERVLAHPGPHTVNLDILDGFKFVKGNAALHWDSASVVAKVKL